MGAFNGAAFHLSVCLCVYLSGFNVDMAQEITDIDKIHPSLQHMHRFGVAQNVGRDLLGQIRVHLSGSVKILFQNICNTRPCELSLLVVHKQRPVGFCGAGQAII